ncbi:MAG TPA: C45 family peptidase [Fimbriimonas sp.]|nr:C45 family peptidase [Fimbriimonas sp.]
MLSPRPPALEGGSREEKGGWIVLHLSGSPHEIGYQHGSLAAKEIDETIKVFKIESQGSGKDWKWYRETARKMFWPKLDPEYQQEIQGIAEGAQSKGIKIDTDDVLALNSEIELSMYYLPALEARQHHTQILSRAPLACSAFVATGSETKDGKVVMGHDFWWGYLTGERWNVILDIKPEKGHHIMLDAAPGLIDSATDWAINDQGIGLCETTISGFAGFDENGTPEFQRMRKSIQYADTLDDIAYIFKQGNNGGYANTWLMVDSRTNEIGKLELGLKNVIFSTSTDGYYVGANFPEDPKLTREEASGYHGDSVCEMRKERWKQLLDSNRGKVDATLAETFLGDTYNSETQQKDGAGGGALCAKGPGFGAINGKVLTSDSLSKMQFWGRFGVPDGSDLLASSQPFQGVARSLFHDVKGNPWTLISG